MYDVFVATLQPCVGLADALEEALDFMIRTDLLRMPEQASAA